MDPSTASTMPAPRTPAPTMDTPAGSQPRRRGASAGGSSGGEGGGASPETVSEDGASAAAS